MASVGIDLGTTTTLLAEAYFDSDTNSVEAAIVPTKQRIYRGHEYTDEDIDYLPSFAFFPDDEFRFKPEDGEAFVGSSAKILGQDGWYWDRCVRAVKRLMGRSLTLPEPIGRTPAQVSSLYLRHVLRHAHRSGMLSDRDELTITVPASFTTNQRRDTLRALDMAADDLKLAYLKEKRGRVLISEPVAALLAYLAHDLKNAESLRRLQLERNPLVLVYDMGGGTLDLTLVQLGWRDKHKPKELDNVRFEIRELSRYNQFGGEDFDTRIAHFLLEKLIAADPQLEQIDLTPLEATALRLRLVEDAEMLKKDLNQEIQFDGYEAEVYISSTPIKLRDKDLAFYDEPVSGSEYVKWVEPFLTYRQDQKNALYPIEALLERSGLKAADIDYFLGIGGMLRFLPLQDALRAYWQNNDKFLIHFAPDQAVAQGAAVYSYLKATFSDFVIDEPPADAYYVRRSRGFGLLLGRERRQQGNKREYELQGEGERLRLQIFAGEAPPPNASIESIYPSLVYQGGMTIPLGKTYPRGTKVWIQMYYRADDNSKVPYIDVWVDRDDNLIASKSYAELVSE